jgi:superoxide dismutase, Fe-Mn family
MSNWITVFSLVTLVSTGTAPLAAQDAPFTLPELPYAYDALEPAIDTETMEIHHGRHHQAYVDNLNAAVQEDDALQGLSLTELLSQVSTLPSAVRNNAGGHYNHSLFWTIMAPVGQGGEPSEALAAAIEDELGSLDELKAQLNAAATSRFGSGWAWLIVDEDGKLAITSSANQDNPLMDDAEQKGKPVLAVDVWEHAYYLKYQNKRAEYLSSWWSVVNWNEVNSLYDEAVSGCDSRRH